MKKNSLKVSLVAAIALVCGTSFLNSQKSATMSDIALANVEALADNEGRDMKINCKGDYLVCRAQYESFCRDLLRNCDEFTGTIELIDCPDL